MISENSSRERRFSDGNSNNLHISQVDAFRSILFISLQISRLAAEYTKIFVDNKKTMLIIYSVLIIQGDE